MRRKPRSAPLSRPIRRHLAGPIAPKRISAAVVTAGIRALDEAVNTVANDRAHRAQGPDWEVKSESGRASSYTGSHTRRLAY